MTGAALERFLYGYDQASNRTSAQIDPGVTSAINRKVNQLTNTAGGRRVRFASHLDETGTALIGASAATMGLPSAVASGVQDLLKTPISVTAPPHLYSTVSSPNVFLTRANSPKVYLY